MKTTLKILFIFGLAAGILGCKKTDVPPASQVAGFNFVNATVGANPVYVQFNNVPVIFSALVTGNKLNYGTANLFSPVGGNVAVSCIQTTDTTHTLFNGTLNLQKYNTYSFFLAGTVNQPDTLLVHDNLPYYPPTDSVGAVRFVNLSAGSNPISVDIQGQPNGSEVTSLAYKGITAFKTYTANHTISSYTFEFRDKALGTLITSYTITGVNNATGKNTATNTFLFKNHTLALIGQPGGTGSAAQKILLINNY